MSVVEFGQNIVWNTAEVIPVGNPWKFSKGYFNRTIEHIALLILHCWRLLQIHSRILHSSIRSLTVSITYASRLGDRTLLVWYYVHWTKCILARLRIIFSRPALVSFAVMFDDNWVGLLGIVHRVNQMFRHSVYKQSLLFILWFYNCRSSDFMSRIRLRV